MPRICYRERRFNRKSQELIQTCNEVIARYTAQGYRLTLRQLYYQLVSANVITNQEKSYDNLGSLVNDARLAGYIDWNAIEDRTRNLQRLSAWENPEEIIRGSADAYRIDRWRYQPVYVEAWIEKEALAGVLARVADDLEIPYFACKGYVSQSELWGAAQRIRYRQQSGIDPKSGLRRTHRDALVIHLGDHDPSGIDMTRDIGDRLEMFGCFATVNRIALNYDQIQRYDPPPNPAKSTDSRFEDYRSRFGSESWELDALEPSVIADLVRATVLEVRSEPAWRWATERQEEDRKLLRACADNWIEEVVPVIEPLIEEPEEDEDEDEDESEESDE